MLFPVKGGIGGLGVPAGVDAEFVDAFRRWENLQAAAASGSQASVSASRSAAGASNTMHVNPSRYVLRQYETLGICRWVGRLAESTGGSPGARGGFSESWRHERRLLRRAPGGSIGTYPRFAPSLSVHITGDMRTIAGRCLWIAKTLHSRARERACFLDDNSCLIEGSASQWEHVQKNTRGDLCSRLHA